ncbi:hypothetical protein EJD97_024114 [Solanum chilense]|uniref:Uncharacterized protein n=1 Tax=Solanum chilense TaxID=4083 RepID=A0A6N2CK69_SOLCI|nr:hypothetical protein EJD97_024114 [Solanum chilense]
MKTWKNCNEIAKVTAYGDIDDPSTTRLLVGGNRLMKEMLLKEDRGILTMCGATKSLDGPSPPRSTVLHIHHC